MRFSTIFGWAAALLVGLAASLALAGPAMAYPDSVAGTGSVSGSTTPGGSVTVAVHHFTPGTVSLVLEPGGTVLGTGTVGADGNGSVSGTVPALADLKPGDYSLVAKGTGGESVSFGLGTVSAGDTFGAAAASASPVAAGPATVAAAPASGGSSGLASTGAAVIGIGVVGVGLVAGGLLFVLGGRRRGQRHTA